jgi:hypothetical protein
MSAINIKSNNDKVHYPPQTTKSIPEKYGFSNKQIMMSSKLFSTIHVLFLGLTEASSKQGEKRQTFC